MSQLEELDYHRIHRAGLPGVWRPLLGVLVVALWFLVLSPLVSMMPFIAWFLVTGQPVLESLPRLIALRDPEPITLAFINVMLGSSILITWFVQRVLHGIKPRWLSSVAPRLRWGYLLACGPLAVVALAATIVVGMLTPQADVAAGMTVDPQPFTSMTVQFIVVILLLTPFQAAAEEYVFRGYLTQALGGVIDAVVLSRVVAVVVPAVLFAMAHGATQGWPIFTDRLAFGIVAGILVIRTGGLEAAIAMHVLNNFVAFGLAIAFGSLGDALNASGGTWWTLPSTMTQSLVYLALALVVARAMKISRTVPPPPVPETAPIPPAGGVLEGPKTPV
jgi:membrane protease YdiL (CAAX protease family)